VIEFLDNEKPSRPYETHL